MQRITITIDDELIESIDRLMKIRGYQNRSEAIRDLVRAGMPRTSLDAGTAPDCIGALVYAYEHDTRQLSRRITSAIHDHHDLSVATTRVPINHEVCLEIAVLRGRTKDVQHFADHVIAERGVSYGQLVTVPVETGDAPHAHGGSRPHRHVRVV